MSNLCTLLLKKKKEDVVREHEKYNFHFCLNKKKMSVDYVKTLLTSHKKTFTNFHGFYILFS